jgi:hypothetical protein
MATGMVDAFEEFFEDARLQAWLGSITEHCESFAGASLTISEDAAVEPFEAHLAHRFADDVEDVFLRLRLVGHVVVLETFLLRLRIEQHSGWTLDNDTARGALLSLTRVKRTDAYKHFDVL